MASHHKALGAWEDLCAEAMEAVAGASAPFGDAQEDATLAELNEEAVRSFNDGKASVDAVQPQERRARGRPGLGSGCSISTVRCAWGSAQEASTLRSLLEVLAPGDCLAEAGLSMLDPAALPPRLSARVRDMPLPPIGASPDAILLHDDGSRETVEVKNVCPFVQDRKRPGGFCVWRGAHNGSPTSGLGRAPHAQLLCTHVPQVQLEMLCAQCRSGRLVSASACFGINEFCVERDDEYLSLMLHFIALFYSRYVRRRTAPEPDFFTCEDTDDGPLYRRLLARTAELARRAQLVRHIEEPWRVGSDEAFFVAS